MDQWTIVAEMITLGNSNLDYAIITQDDRMKAYFKDRAEFYFNLAATAAPDKEKPKKPHWWEVLPSLWK